MTKNSWSTTYLKKGKVIRTLPQKFSLKNEAHPKRINIGYLNSRWHPYEVWCMGNCNYCKNGRGYIRWRKSKHNRKRNTLKFDWFFDYP